MRTKIKVLVSGKEVLPAMNSIPVRVGRVIRQRIQELSISLMCDEIEEEEMFEEVEEAISDAQEFLDRTFGVDVFDVEAGESEGDAASDPPMPVIVIHQKNLFKTSVN